MPARGRVRTRAWLLVALCVASVCSSSLSLVFAADRYVRAAVDPDGQLLIVDSGGHTFVPIKDGEQVGFSKPRISEDGATVGWLAEYPNCCTSYPIPLKLIIYRNGISHAFKGNGVPIWRWAFQQGGRQFVFQQETVHGGFSIHYELHDVATGALIAEYSPEYGPDNTVLPEQRPPEWVAAFDQPIKD